MFYNWGGRSAAETKPSNGATDFQDVSSSIPSSNPLYSILYTPAMYCYTWSCTALCEILSDLFIYMMVKQKRKK